MVDVSPRTGGHDPGEGQVTHVNDSYGRHAAAVPHIFTASSVFDSRCNLHIEKDDAWIEFHEDTPPFVLADMTAVAREHGYKPDPTGDEYDYLVELDEPGMLRFYLVEYIAVFMPYQRSALPDLSQTAYGPQSGEMPAVVVV